MYRKSLKVLSILFFSIAVLARSTTGAPNAQVEVFNSDLGLISASSHTPQAQAPYFASPKPNLGLEDTNFKKESSKSHIKSYKKYVSPDRNSDFHSSSNPIKQTAKLLKLHDTWIFNSLPRVIHSNAPPVSDALTSHTGFLYFKGALNIERSNSNYSGWRVSLLSSRP